MEIKQAEETEEIVKLKKIMIDIVNNIGDIFKKNMLEMDELRRVEARIDFLLNTLCLIAQAEIYKLAYQIHLADPNMEIERNYIEIKNVFMFYMKETEFNNIKEIFNITFDKKALN